jgi:hypothetical protein
LSIGRQAIEKRLISFEDLRHWPSPTYRDHQFMVHPLDELSCILVRHWGNLYSKKTTNKQSNTKSKRKSYSDSDSDSILNPNSASSINLYPNTSKTEGQEESGAGDGDCTDGYEEQQSLSLQFDRTFILKPNSVKETSWYVTLLVFIFLSYPLF